MKFLPEVTIHASVFKVSLLRRLKIVPRKGICCSIPATGPKKPKTLSKSPLKSSLRPPPMFAMVRFPSLIAFSILLKIPKPPLLPHLSRVPNERPNFCCSSSCLS